MTTLTLEELLDTQAKLQRAMGATQPALPVDAPMHLLAAIAELAEALNELNWKPWRRTTHRVNKERYAEELTDALQFWANAAAALGLTAEDLTSALRRKWEINHQRIVEGY